MSFRKIRAVYRFWFLAASLVALIAITACSNADPTPTQSDPTATPLVPTATAEVPTATQVPPTEVEASGGGFEEPEQEWVVRTENEEVNLILATPDLAPGTRRFGVVLTDKSGIVALPVVQLASFKYPDGSEAVEDREGPVETALARYYPFPYGTRGIHVTEFTFDEPGIWGIEASIPRPDGDVAKIEVILEVHEQTMSVDVGEVPPLSESRTLADVDDVSDLTTGSNRDESLYQVSVADALQNDKATVIVFASPAFCTNAVCGPQVEVLSNLSASYGDSADFIHIDLFTNPKEIQGDLTRAMQSPLLSEWGLVSQEWTFVMDEEGKVVGRYENFVPQEELEPLLMSVLNAETTAVAEEPAAAPTSTPVPPPATPEPPPATPEPPTAAPEPPPATPEPPTVAPEPPTVAPEPPTVTPKPSESQPDSMATRGFNINQGTLWIELFEQFHTSEQDCIRDAVSGDQLDAILDRRVMEDGDTQPLDNDFLGCLDDATIDAIFLATLLSNAEGLSEIGVGCVVDLVSNADLPAIIASEQLDASPEDIATTGEFYGGLMACQLVDQIGNIEDLDENDKCFADLLATTDFAEVYFGQRPDASPENLANFEAFMAGMFSCLAGAMEADLEGAAGNPQPSQ